MLQMAKVIFCFAVVGCRSNNECAEKQACIAKECRNPCEEKACLRNEVCEVVQHSARCITGKFNYLVSEVIGILSQINLQKR